MNDDINIAFMVDGSFLPIRNGTYYSIYTLMGALSKIKNIKPNLLICWRGWDNPSDYFNQSFSTIFLPSKSVFNEDGYFEYAMRNLNINFMQLYSAEEVIIFASRLKELKIKIVYEAINIDHVLYEGLGADKDVVLSAKSKQTSAMELADHILCRSEIDKNHILNMGIDKNKIRIYRGAIDTSIFSPTKHSRQGKKIVFLGNMYYPPNENALKLIAKYILPALKNINDQYSVTVIGDTPKATLEDSSNHGIIFKQGVDDLNRELSQYDLAVAPIFEGSGTRLKILDFMAAGLPVITTKLGVEGLHSDIYKNVIIEDDINSYANIIDTVICNSKIYQKFASNGRSFINKYYNWNDENLEPFVSIYKEYKVPNDNQATTL